MRSILSRRPSPGMVIALIALFVALGGTAMALQRNSVESKHIVDGQVKAQDLDDDSVNNTKIVDDSVGSDDIRDGDVGSDDIGLGAIQSADVANNALTTADVDDDTLRQPIDGLRYVRADGEAAGASPPTTLDLPCQGGEYPLAGGYILSDSKLQVLQSRPVDLVAPVNDPDAWRLVVASNSAGGTSFGFSGYAMCAPAKGVKGV